MGAFRRRPSPVSGAGLQGRPTSMALSLYELSVPVFQRGMTAFLAILDKAEAHATARKFDPTNYLALRLAPDQFAFARQVQSFCDHAKNGSSRLAGLEPPFMEDKETTFAELRARIAATLDLAKTIDSGSVDAASDRDITFPVGPRKMTLRADHLSVAFRVAELLFPPHDRLRHFARRRRRDRQARLHGRLNEGIADHDHHPPPYRPAHVAGRHSQQCHLSGGPGG